MDGSELPDGRREAVSECRAASVGARTAAHGVRVAASTDAAPKDESEASAEPPPPPPPPPDDAAPVGRLEPRRLRLAATVDAVSGVPRHRLGCGVARRGVPSGAGFERVLQPLLHPETWTCGSTSRPKAHNRLAWRTRMWPCAAIAATSMPARCRRRRLHKLLLRGRRSRSPGSLTTSGNRTILSRDCPFCNASEALIIVGARASSLLSVVRGQTFAYATPAASLCSGALGAPDGAHRHRFNVQGSCVDERL